jgi:N-acetylglucosamine-6-phosphate deacetylase
MRVALLNGRVLQGDALAEGQCVLLDGARIAAILDADDPRCRDAQRYDLGGGLLLPG